MSVVAALAPSRSRRQHRWRMGTPLKRKRPDLCGCDGIEDGLGIIFKFVVVLRKTSSALNGCNE